jgi:beta-glucosidase
VTVSAKFTFPEKFLWGTATSAHQVEGENNNNNWSLWEAQPGRIRNGDVSGKACDWWKGRRWQEDFLRAADTGQNTHRMSIEWSRIQPKENLWDESAIDYYREMIRGMISRGLRPLITLHHFTDPIWFYEMGGWQNEKAPEYFLRFAEKIIPAFKPLVKDWITINEPNVYILCGFISGHFPPGNINNFSAANIVLRNMIKAHAAVYHLIHEQQPEASVGIAIHFRDLFPKTNLPPDRWMTRLAHHLFNNSFTDTISSGKFHYGPYFIHIPQAKNTQDFLGLNFYSGNQVRFTFNPNNFLSYPEGASLSDTGFIANEPESFSRALKWAAGYGKPILITENGTESDEDTFRRDYLAAHIHRLWRAWSNGIPVKGYYHWSLIDNFEWERGWSQRFGLWRLNVETQVRTKRLSADFYERICRKNSLDSEDMETFAPRIYREIFPV